MTQRRLLTDVLPCLLWMGVIFFFSHQCAEQIGEWYGVFVRPVYKQLSGFLPLERVPFFKLAHFAEYAVLAILFWRLWRVGVSGRVAYLLAALSSLLFALADEFHQSFIPGRHPSLLDVGIDALGIVTGLSMLLVWRLFVRNPDHSAAS